MEFDPHTRLAGECLQPLGHLSRGLASLEAAVGWSSRVRSPLRSRARQTRRRSASRHERRRSAILSAGSSLGPRGSRSTSLPSRQGGVAERLNAAVLKTVVRLTGVPRVRISPPPLQDLGVARSSGRPDGALVGLPSGQPRARIRVASDTASRRPNRCRATNPYANLRIIRDGGSRTGHGSAGRET